MPSYDVLTDHDFRAEDSYAIGDPAPRLGIPDYPEMHVVAVGPPIHRGKDATIVIAYRKTPMLEVQELLDRAGLEQAEAADEARERVEKASGRANLDPARRREPRALTPSRPPGPTPRSTDRPRSGRRASGAPSRTSVFRRRCHADIAPAPPGVRRPWLLLVPLS